MGVFHVGLRDAHGVILPFGKTQTKWSFEWNNDLFLWAAVHGYVSLLEGTGTVYGYGSIPIDTVY